jgi:hypothetical protein
MAAVTCPGLPSQSAVQLDQSDRPRGKDNCGAHLGRRKAVRFRLSHLARVTPDGPDRRWDRSPGCGRTRAEDDGPAPGRNAASESASVNAVGA